MICAGNNSPRVLIVTWGAMRTMDIIKKMKPFEVRVAKLFSKHFKVAQQRDMLQQNYHPIAVGTPNRLEKLLEVGALSLNQTDLILIDMSQNQKKATILEANDVS
jgi:protein CMS1